MSCESTSGLDTAPGACASFGLMQRMKRVSAARSVLVSSWSWWMKRLDRYSRCSESQSFCDTPFLTWWMKRLAIVSAPPFLCPLCPLCPLLLSSAASSAARGNSAPTSGRAVAPTAAAQCG